MLKLKNKFVGSAVLVVLLFTFSLPVSAAMAWVDVTSQYLTNPSFNNNSKDGWTLTGYYSAQNLQYECMEIYNGTFDVSQEIASLPSGHYRLHVQGFYRTTGNDAAYQAHRNGTENITAFLYAGGSQTKLHSVYDHVFGTNLGNNCWSYGNWWEGLSYFPNGMLSAHEAFEQGCYWNVVEFDVSSDGPVTIGIKNATSKNENWCIFDNFRLEYYDDVPEPTSENLQFNEIMSANIDVFWSPVGNFNGWVELYNPSTSPVKIGGSYLSDGVDSDTRWQIPDDYELVPSGGYVLLWFDDNNLSPHQVPFKLDVDGGTICLYDSQGQLILSQSYPAAIGRTSYARSVDGVGEWLLTGDPTPAATNKNLVPPTAQLPLPQVSAESQIINGSLSFTVTAPEGATLRYTTDGSTPTLTSGVTASPQDATSDQRFDFTVSTTINYRFRLFRDGYLPSEVVTRSFIKSRNAYTVPVLSVVSDADFLYGNQHGVMVKGTNGRPGHGQAEPCNWNMDWERPVFFTLLSPSGQHEFSQDVSLSMCGGWSRAWNPHSFKLKANKVYGTGKTLDHEFFADKPYIRNRTLQMRNGGNDNVCRIKDPIIETLILRSGIDLDAQSYQPVVHYLNGKYIGVINMREPNNKHFVFANRGWDDDEIDLFEMDADSGYVQKCGTIESFDRLYTLSQHVNEAGVYDEIRQLLDVDEYINYMAATLYLGGNDWPQNNIKGYKHRDGRFRFVSFDQDFAFSETDPFTTFFNKRYHMFDWLYDKQTRYQQEIRMVTIFQNLLAHEGFRRQFIDVFCIMGGSVFEANRSKAVVDELANAIAPMMKFENGSPWNTANDMKNKFTNWVSTVTNSLKRYSLFKLSGVTTQAARLSSGTQGATLFINDLEVPYAEFNGRLFAPVTLRAEAPAGYKFEGWRNQNNGQYYSYDAETTMPTGSFNLMAIFTPIADDGQSATRPAVVINEVSAANDTYVNDYFKRADWVELYNTTDQPISVEGMYLSDDPSNPHKCRIELPASSADGNAALIPAHGHLVVWCDKREPITQLHASFKLADDGGSVMITAADDSWSNVLQYAAHTMDETVVRYPDGGAKVYLTNVPTIGKHNVRTSYQVAVEQTPNGIRAVDAEVASLAISYVVDCLVVTAPADVQGEIIVHDSAGRQVYVSKASMSAGRNEITLPSLPRGYYIATVVTPAGQRKSCKLIVR
ncbi:MAG: CotH kinase family protein [Prevotella sp.]|nr:CotH kinase family protein [Prevotella sp.]